MSRIVSQRLQVEFDDQGRRLDQLLAERWQDFSRSRLADWIRSGQVRVNGERVKPRHAVSPGDQITLDAELADHPDTPQPQAIALEVLVDHPELLIVNKPPGLVVHPGSGNPDGTLVNALLHFDPELAALPRAGLVHRLDKDTSGCLVIARTTGSHRFLVAAMKKRLIKRHYQAVVWGELIAGGTVDQPLGRHPVDRRKQVVRPDGRHAVTHYRVAQRLTSATLLDVQLETGRTHQIRVHLAHAGFPILGDPMYGRRGAPADLSAAQRETWLQFPRQALHACRIQVPLPGGGDPITAEAALPDDMRALIDGLAGGHD